MKAPTAKQIAARERFAAMARSGAFKRKPKAKRAPNPRLRQSRELGEFFVRLPGRKGARDAWITTRNAKGGWNSSTDFSDARAMSASQAANVKAHCDLVREVCEVLPVTDNPKARKRNPKSSTASQRNRVAHQNPKGRAATITSAEVWSEDGGFEYGMDAVTPQLFHFTTRGTKKAYRSWRLPDAVIANPNFQRWVQDHNKVGVFTLNQLKDRLREFLPLGHKDRIANPLTVKRSTGKAKPSSSITWSNWSGYIVLFYKGKTKPEGRPTYALHARDRKQAVTIVRGMRDRGESGCVLLQKVKAPNP